MKHLPLLKTEGRCFTAFYPTSLLTSITLSLCNSIRSKLSHLLMVATALK